MIQQYFKIFISSAIVFLVFDLFWSLVVSKRMYQQFIDNLLGDVRIFPSIFYVIYAFWITVFVLIPRIERNHLGYPLLSGAFYGSCKSLIT
ncbi:TPA: DUF2177 family protein [Enterococcus faecalis]|uniref:DUF2177 family protein n=1 Tax=Enterococcus faecalis TaxID=1351 RepID=UPI003B891268